MRYEMRTRKRKIDDFLLCRAYKTDANWLLCKKDIQNSNKDLVHMFYP